ncbi:type I-E CRISPR-associated protein Cas7/Cse4/CasC [Magnetovirga frankeli]|uniref:type I-E CRISPR-associated protein Cas7/Cse4/CasC n=1 Tax=Magnetovirga frankeli TaxID=947516 RepID=UPI00129374B9|nr:type I-E CRISPR-associated protein Cas7/Cse4/CasC [gamma proteobacterium SS-5]
MNRFLQLHLLTSYPPSNLNRDDLGRPKTAMMGGETRLRVSSQSLKRAWRTSDTFVEALQGHVGTRTKEMGNRTAKLLTDTGVKEKQAREWARAIAEQFGKLKKAKDDGSEEGLHIEQLAHFGPEEEAGVDALCKALAERQSAPEAEELKLLRGDQQAADIALFGRMLAAAPRFNVEAAAQVAHAITVHKVAVEDDFFTAVDDLNNGEEDMGAGHMGETEFGAGLFYLYVCIDRELLVKNLQGDRELANKTLAALVESAATVSPTGKQNSFASRARASYLLAETGNQQPRSLSVAFLESIRGKTMLKEAIERLTDARDKMDRVYGSCSDKDAVLNAYTGEGSLADVIACATE